MRIFYSLGVNIYVLAVHIATLWNPKARKWVSGRRHVWNELEDFQSGKFVIWFHCASLGEFEQGRPLIEEIRENQQCQIVLTFFSPSGYEIRKNYQGADLVLYLPKDSKKNARKFLDAIKPTHVFFVKYEFWANYILTCRERRIPIYSVSALFRKDQIFFKSYGTYMRKVLSAFTKIFVQNEASKQLLQTINIPSKVCGDTRYDRVMKNAEKVLKYPEVTTFCGDRKIFICGSVWEEDLEVIKSKIDQLKTWRVIIAPHEISEKFIQKIETSIERAVIRYSQIANHKNEDILIIDNVGMLMNLYQYGTAAFIGGGYRTGLHNILEPAAFGLPVFFGDKIGKFPEAHEFIENGIGFSVSGVRDFDLIFEQVIHDVTKERVLTFMESKKGATGIILEEILM